MTRRKEPPANTGVSPVIFMPPKKRQRTEADSSVQKLEEALTEAIQSSSSLNGLADLVLLATSSHSAKITHDAMFASYRIFVQLVSNGKLSMKRSDKEELETVRLWLVGRLGEFVDALCGFLKDLESGIRVRLRHIISCSATQ